MDIFSPERSLVPASALPPNQQATIAQVVQRMRDNVIHIDHLKSRNPNMSIGGIESTFIQPDTNTVRLRVENLDTFDTSALTESLKRTSSDLTIVSNSSGKWLVWTMVQAPGPGRFRQLCAFAFALVLLAFAVWLVWPAARHK